MVKATFFTKNEIFVENFEAIDQVSERASTISGLIIYRAVQHSAKRTKKKKEDRRR